MGGMAVVLGGVLLLGASAATAYEPPHELGDRELRYEIQINTALQRYVARNGLPDIAEWRFLADAPPWDDHEVAVYYLDMHKELGFARAWALGEPCIAKVRFERALSDDEVSELAPRARQYGGKSCSHRGCPGPGTLPQGKSNPMAEGEHPRYSHAPNGPAERAEAAADRAEAAANRVDAAAQVAERAADRSEAVVAKLEEQQIRRPPFPPKPHVEAPSSPSVAP